PRPAASPPSLCPLLRTFGPHPPPTLFPYTTLFRSVRADVLGAHDVVRTAVRLARDHRQLRHRRLGIGVEQLGPVADDHAQGVRRDRKSTRLNSSHVATSYAVICLKRIRHRSCALLS